jgi:hypothetical protein
MTGTPDFVKEEARRHRWRGSTEPDVIVDL